MNFSNILNKTLLICDINEKNNYCVQQNPNKNKSTVDSNLFYERFCDDLCELILSYLSIEDKFRLESVSKQFQRCIFNKQFVIQLKNSSEQKYSTNLFNCLIHKSNSKYINIKSFEILLKKCKFCNEILIKTYFIANRQEVLKSIIKNCNYLKSILFDFNELSAEIVYEFGLIFGPKLQKLSFVFANPVKSVENYLVLLRLCPNLMSLNKVKLKHLIAVNERLVPKIKQIDMFYGKTDAKYVKYFVEIHKNNLKSIKINTEVNCDLLNEFLKELPNFKNLEVLEIWSTVRMLYIDIEFVKSIKLIGSECKKLKHFKLMTNKMNPTIASKLFESLNSFNSLIDLDLRLLFRLKLDDNQTVSLKSINACKRLETIQLNYSGINDRFFVDIDLHFNQLRRLCLTVDQITDRALKSISKLKQLRYLSLDVHHSRSIGFPLVTDSGLCDVIYHCRSIESIIFYGRPNITIVTINALVLLALSKPKVDFNHYFGYIERKFSSDYTPIELVFVTNLPKNIMISTELSTYFA